ncbi:hypothetical protein IWX49DRAFT_437992 [Phyllosticta citricarpa]|uniref:Uncharacterized protein n=2 Tax=Phyllosticta TaxID=121621 RepID=A0ABR1M2Z4_9PEZI
MAMIFLPLMQSLPNAALSTFEVSNSPMGFVRTPWSVTIMEVWPPLSLLDAAPELQLNNLRPNSTPQRQTSKVVFDAADWLVGARHIAAYMASLSFFFPERYAARKGAQRSASTCTFSEGNLFPLSKPAS